MEELILDPDKLPPLRDRGDRALMAHVRYHLSQFNTERAEAAVQEFIARLEGTLERMDHMADQLQELIDSLGALDEAITEQTAAFKQEIDRLKAEHPDVDLARLDTIVDGITERVRASIPAADVVTPPDTPPVGEQPVEPGEGGGIVGDQGTPPEDIPPVPANPTPDPDAVGPSSPPPIGEPVEPAEPLATPGEPPVEVPAPGDTPPADQPEGGPLV